MFWREDWRQGEQVTIHTVIFMVNPGVIKMNFLCMDGPMSRAVNAEDCLCG